MDQICLVVPVQAGHASDARDFMRELETERKDDYARSEQRIGIDKEVWFIAEVPGGEALVAYMECDNFESALEKFVASRDEFDLWFKGRFNDATGVDLNDPREMALPELLSSYSV